MSYLHVAFVAAQCAFPGFDIEVSFEDDRAYLRVVCPEGSPYSTPDMPTWKGRKWRLSKHMTDGEVVQTAFKAILTALEHEAREQFTFRGAAVMSPHMDIYGLVELAQRGPVGRE